MKHHTTWKWLLACCVSLLLFTVQVAAPVRADDALDVLTLVNQERANVGVGPLTLCARLNIAAQNHTNDMIAQQFFDHVNPLSGKDPGDRITDAGYNWTAYGENIAVGYSTPQSVVAGWMGSSGHRANILDPSFVHMGLGSATGNYMGFNSKYWTQTFGAGGQCGVLLTEPIGSLTASAPKFSWYGLAGAVRYDLQIGTTNPPTSTPINVPTSSYTPATAMTPGTYYWRVQAYQANNVPLDTWSQVKTFTLTSPANAAPILNYTPVQSLTLTWNRVTGATGYDLEVANTGAMTNPLVQVSISGLSYTVSGLTEGTYYWRVRSKNGSTLGTWSVVQSFTLKP